MATACGVLWASSDSGTVLEATTSGTILEATTSGTILEAITSGATLEATASGSGTAATSSGFGREGSERRAGMIAALGVGDGAGAAVVASKIGAAITPAVNMSIAEYFIVL